MGMLDIRYKVPKGVRSTKCKKCGKPVFKFKLKHINRIVVVEKSGILHEAMCPAEKKTRTAVEVDVAGIDVSVGGGG